MTRSYAGPHYVYRCYDASGRLLYVGCTQNLEARLRAHTSAFWALDVVKVKARVYPDRVTALAVESTAIKTENPRYNVKQRWASRFRWTLDDADDYLRAVGALTATGYTAAHLAQAERFRDHLAQRVPA